MLRTLVASSDSNIGLNGVGLDDGVGRGNGVNSVVALSMSTVSRLVDVDDADSDPSAVSTRE